MKNSFHFEWLWREFYYFCKRCMGRILAIDYGKKRTGIAVSDPLKLIAGGLTTVPTTGLMSFLKTTCRRRRLSCLS